MLARAHERIRANLPIEVLPPAAHDDYVVASPAAVTDVTPPPSALPLPSETVAPTPTSELADTQPQFWRPATP